jgi:hypothetical protein
LLDKSQTNSALPIAATRRTAIACLRTIRTLDKTCTLKLSVAGFEFSIMRATASLVLLTLVQIAGAEPPRAGPNWWSLQQVLAPKLHQGASARDRAHPIDLFIKAKLDLAGLKSAPSADNLTLIRRVTFDLTGLPPTPNEIDDFLSDRSFDAYERLIDRLLASPAYGERWARHWLDIVRFSESHGFEYDRLRDNAWNYRDYVIRSFNSDKPYAQFVREQIAGDVLPDTTIDGIVATGMLVAGPYDQAGHGSRSATIRAKTREDELEDLLGTVSQTFLGVTLNCARCHDHKFDPYTAKDYYRLKAIFEGAIPGDRKLLLKGGESINDAVIRIDSQLGKLLEQQERLENKARERIPKSKSNNKSLPRPIARWTFDEDGRDSVGQLHAELKNGASIARGRLILDGKKGHAESAALDRDLKAKTFEAWVALSTLKQRGGGVIGVQSLDGTVFDSIVFAEQKPLHWLAGSDFFKRTRDVNGSDETAKRNELVHIAISYAADGRIAIYRNGRPYGDPYTPDDSKSPVTFTAKKSQIIFGMRHKGGGNAWLEGEIEEARLYDSALTPEQLLASYKAGVASISLEDLRAAMSDVDRRTHRANEKLIAELESELAKLRRPPMTYAINPKEPEPTLFLKRGDVEKPGDAVTPGSPATVKGPPAVDLPEDAAEADRRRAFADWVAHRDNPLTWRVIVNRIWQHHFGEGIVRTPNDFGFNGERPTHPELLDWLAATFRDSGGQLKPLHRLIVTSDTYRQSSTFDPKAAELDAENRLLWRFAPRRLEAEAIRDAMLAASGKLNREAGGPSFRPFRIETFNSAFYIPFDEDRPDFNRRSIYRMNVTSARDPVLDVLDCPDPSVKTPKRNTTTTPLQALTMMNNAFTNRMAKSFAERIEKEAENAAEQVTLAYRLSLGRNPTAAERNRAEKVVREVGLRALAFGVATESSALRRVCSPATEKIACE